MDAGGGHLSHAPASEHDHLTTGRHREVKRQAVLEAGAPGVGGFCLTEAVPSRSQHGCLNEQIQNKNKKQTPQRSSFPVLHRHTLLAVTVLDSADIEHSHHHSKFR